MEGSTLTVEETQDLVILMYLFENEKLKQVRTLEDVKEKLISKIGTVETYNNVIDRFKQKGFLLIDEDEHVTASKKGLDYYAYIFSVFLANLTNEDIRKSIENN